MNASLRDREPASAASSASRTPPLAHSAHVSGNPATPLEHSSPSSRLSLPLDPVAVASVECDEMRARTILLCDELTGFQRIVSYRSAERHGVWSYSLADERHEYVCEQCGHYGTARVVPKRGLRDPLPFECHGVPVKTPACSYAELQSSQGCLHTRDALRTLQRRECFDRDVGTLLKRLQMASKGIQDSVM